MTVLRFSVNKLCITMGTTAAVLFAMMTAIVYRITGDPDAIGCCLAFAALIYGCMICLLMGIRRRLTAFTDELCQLMDRMMNGSMEVSEAAEEESLFYKVNHRLNRLYEVMQENRRRVAEERRELQELISDISHQVKTPIANLKNVNATLLEQKVPREKQLEFLEGMTSQIDKLDFLLQGMVKTSRLETGVITLEKKVCPIYGTLASALGGIIFGAEKKGIQVDVKCPETLEVSHDSKWTGEALFNILDNAVKYTPKDGRIKVTAESYEMYLKIEIKDTGPGIPEQQQGAVFKRFYRGEEVHETDGIGLGLYLAREIISLQGGYIKVASEPGKGSAFSVFLPYK